MTITNQPLIFFVELHVSGLIMIRRDNYKSGKLKIELLIEIIEIIEILEANIKNLKKYVLLLICK